MVCPRCSAATDDKGVCAACAEPDIGSSATMLTPAPPTSSTMHYGSGALTAPGPGSTKSEKKESAHAIGVRATVAGELQSGSATALAKKPPRDSASTEATNTMVDQRLGSYRILDVLGEGGMGRVYLAEHVKLSRRVALKMLHPHFAQSPEVVRRFFDEARAVNRILHEHIVEITDFVENEEGNNYFIMEHLKGAPLSDVMDGDEGSRISRCLGIGVQVASALSAVHAANIVHRDLKPENIFLTQRGGQEEFVKLLDFGIAKLVGDDGGGMKLQTTEAGMIMGTPDYMSPEQASAAKLDYRTDIYSLGVILYELCTGILPFRADNFGDLVVLHKTKRPVRPNKVRDLPQRLPDPLEALIMDCLEKEPSKRPQSAQEVEDRLNEISWSFAVELEQFELTGADGRRSGRRGVIFGAAGLVAAAAALTFALTRGDAKSAESTEAPPAAPIAEMSKAPVIVVAPDKEVAVSFLSEPKGAMVYTMGADQELMGVTPFTGSLAKGSDPIQFEFRLPGHLSKAVSLTPNKRDSLQVKLEALPPKVLSAKEQRAAKRRQQAKIAAAKKARTEKGQAKTKSQKFKEGAVMDPFAKKK